MQHCRKQANVMSRIRRSATKHHLFWDFADGSHQLGFIFDIWLECFEAGPFTFCTPQMSRFHHKTIIFWLLREIPVLKWKFTRAGCYMWSQNNLFGRGEAACGSPPKMIFKGTGSNFLLSVVPGSLGVLYDWESTFNGWSKNFYFFLALPFLFCT